MDAPIVTARNGLWRGLRAQCQPIAPAPDIDDQARTARVVLDLFTEIADVETKVRCCREVRRAPNLPKEFMMGAWAAAGPQQRHQQAELGTRKRAARIRAMHHSTDHVDFDARQAQHRQAQVSLAAPA